MCDDTWVKFDFVCAHFKSMLDMYQTQKYTCQPQLKHKLSKCSLINEQLWEWGYSTGVVMLEHDIHKKVGFHKDGYNMIWICVSQIQ